MRLARLVCVLFAVLAGFASHGQADVLGGAVRLAVAQPGQPGQSGGGAGGAGGAAAASQAPAQSADLTAWAGEPRATTLPELLQIAVRQSPTLASARIDIAVAEARIQQTWARNDWQLKAQIQGTRGTGIPETGTGTTIDLDDKVSGTIDLSRALPTGGTVGLHVGSTWEYTRAHTVQTSMGQELSLSGTTTAWTEDVSGSITQPLLRGRGRALFEANEVKATLARDSAVLAKRLTAIQTVQTVISGYWDLVLAEQTVAITRGSLDLARERLRVTQIGADGGKVPRSEIPAVLQIIATREEDVLNGELGAINASIGLRRATGMPIGGGELGLRVATDLGTKDTPIDLHDLVERAYQASPQLAQLAKQDASATVDVMVAENGLLPQLDAALSLGPTGIADTFPDSWSNLAKFKTIGIQGSLTFTQSIQRNDALGRFREQRELKHKLTVNAFDVRAQVAQAMSQAVAQLEVARRRVTLSQRAIDLANENIKIETDRFNLGKATNFDVLNRLEELRQAELRKTQALIDWHKAEVVIQALTGDILPMYGIAVE